MVHSHGWADPLRDTGRVVVPTPGRRERPPGPPAGLNPQDGYSWLVGMTRCLRFGFDQSSFRYASPVRSV
jgi:hypothetical protein